MSEKVNDDGAAFPVANDDRPGAYPAEPGMSLRDYFAANIPEDEVADITHRSLSLMSSEILTGGKRPERPRIEGNTEETMKYQLAVLKWECDVRAAVRFAMADAMIRVREVARHG